MKYKVEDKKKIVDNWFNHLQNQISSQFQFLENSLSKKGKKFEIINWKKKIKVRVEGSL